MAPPLSSRKYFATLPEFSQELGSELQARVDRHYDRLPSMRAYRRAKRNRALYFGYPSEASPFDGGMIGEAGEQGELTYAHFNRLHHVAQRILSKVVVEDFGWQPVAANNDVQSQEQAILAGSVLDFEKREKKLAGLMRQVAEATLLDGEGWPSIRWDPRGGKLHENVPAEDGTPQSIYEGKLIVKRHSFFRLVADWTRDDPEHEWVIITEFVNKYDLAARYRDVSPGMEEKLISLGPDHKRIMDWQRAARGRIFDDTDTSRVPVYTLYHVHSEAVPQGREVVFVDGGLVLSDGPNPYGELLPLERMTAGDILDTAHGHAPMTDISALQGIYNMLLSTAVTNHVNGGVNTIVMPEGSNVQPAALFGGANVITYAGQRPPEALTLARTDPMTVELAQLVANEMVTLVGENDVSMGNPQRDMSGAAMALLDAKALEFASGFISSYRLMLGRVGTAIVDRYKRFAKAPRSLEVIVGQQRSRMLKDFVGSQIGDVERVTVEVRGPLLETTAGKLDFAEKMMAAPPELRGPLVQVYKTGNIDVMLEPTEHETMLVERENDQLRQGIVPPVMATDPHVDHLRKHRVVLASPEAREDPSVVGACTAHDQAHIDALRMTDPGLLLALGQQPIPPPGMMIPPGAPGEAPPEEASAVPEGLGAAAGAPEPELPGPPDMPTNPSTGQEAPLPAVAMQ
jgi:hypothetical protein